MPMTQPRAWNRTGRAWYVLAQLGLPVFVAKAGWEHFAQFVCRLLAGRQIYIQWAALAFLMCLSATAGALMNRLRAKAGIRKRNGESTVRELAMLRTVVANLPDLIYVKDSGNRFLLANQGTADFVGAATGAGLRGKTDFDFFPDELAAGFFEDEQKVMLSGRTRRHSRKPQRKTKKVARLESSGGTLPAKRSFQL
jgi:PAS domain-containing protein